MDRFSKNTQIPNLMKILPVGAELFHADGRRENTKLVVAFHNFAKVPIKVIARALITKIKIWKSQIVCMRTGHTHTFTHTNTILRFEYGCFPSQNTIQCSGWKFKEGIEIKKWKYTHVGEIQCAAHDDSTPQQETLLQYLQIALTSLAAVHTSNNME